MYEQFFKLNRKPFDLLPNPDFLFMSKSHKRAVSYIDYGIRERMGFILLTGEVGSGKTTIIRNLIKKNLVNVVLSKIFNTRVDSLQLIAMINDDFGLPVQNRDKITMLRDLNTFLIEQFIKGKQPVLIIDEAQNLNNDLLEEIRMLSNLETDNSKLLQIILVGQPELRQTIASGSMIQLRQRISINCHITPLSCSETEEYVLHRMERAGNREAVSFKPETMQIVYLYSRGIPRLINIICDFILLAAFAEETTVIEASLVYDIIGDLDFEHHFWGSESSDGKIPDKPQNEIIKLPDFKDKTFSVIVRDLNERRERLGKEPDNGSHEVVKKTSIIAPIPERPTKLQQEPPALMVSELPRNIFKPPPPTPVKSAKSDLTENINKSNFGNIFSRIFMYRF